MANNSTSSGFKQETLLAVFKTVFKDQNTKVNKDALQLSAEFLKLFVQEAFAQAAAQAKIENGVDDLVDDPPPVDVTVPHLEKILPQLFRTRLDDYLADQSSLRRQALPLEESEGELPEDPNGIPVSGAQYLRMVRSEAAACPQIMVARAPEGLSMPTPGVPNVRDIFNQPLQDDPCPQQYLPSRAWKQDFLDGFGKLRVMVEQYVADKWSVPPFHPQPRDKKEWKKFCYGTWGDSAPQTVENHEEQEEEEEAYDEAEGQIFDEEQGEGYVESGDGPEETIDVDNAVEGGADNNPTASAPEQTTNPISPPPPGRDPYIHLVVHLSHQQTLKLLKFHCGWLSDTDISTLELRWLFALFSRLDTLLTGEELQHVRKLCKKCRSIRVALANSGVAPDDARVAGLNMIVAIVGGVFGQADLSDDV
ncbi:gem (nuclear organelle) associated protein 2 [Borealophlyctis nickersoniae]|nr:gem (nuclear organelle) associated protein 2 [Borealophlyctis nickersoniae]